MARASFAVARPSAASALLPAISSAVWVFGSLWLTEGFVWYVLGVQQLVAVAFKVWWRKRDPIYSARRAIYNLHILQCATQAKTGKKAAAGYTVATRETKEL